MNNKIIALTAVVAICLSIGIFYYLILPVEQSEYDQELLTLKNKVREDLKKYNMIQRIKKNRGLLEPKTNFSNIERLSQYQTFVTPNNPMVKTYIQTEGIYTAISAYTHAVEWTWVSDNVMHGVNEKWLKPFEFIIDTPDKAKYPNNPVDGMASDCESQAYTLVSILESIGISPDNVRVCIGLVDFGSGSAGHAWVQIYQNNEWMELEPTSGPYYDEDTNTLVNSSGANFIYFKTQPYPVEEYWAFFNDVYYFNPDTGVKSGNLPVHWMDTEKRFSIEEIRERIKEANS